MLDFEVLVRESIAIDALSTHTIKAGEITSLNHELRDNTVENGSLIVQGLSILAYTLLARAQSTEILSSLRNHIPEETEYHSLFAQSFNLDIEIDLMRYGRSGVAQTRKSQTGQCN